MKTYKVLKDLIIGKVLGNSSVAVSSGHKIISNEYVKIDESGLVFGLYDQAINKRRESFKDAPEQLKLSKDEIQKYFKECGNLELKIVEVKYSIYVSDYGNTSLYESYDSHIDAILECERLNTLNQEYYSVQMDYVAEWKEV